MVGEGRHGAVFIVQHKHSEEYYACKLLNKLDNEVWPAQPRLAF